MSASASPAARRARSLAAGGVCAFLAAAIVSVGLSRQANRLHQPALAARLLGDRGEAEAQRADLAFTAGDGAAAALAAANALHRSLTHVEALRVLGRVRDAASDPSGAQLIVLAGALSWRDSETQDWLLQHTLAAGDYAGAMTHADALLRRKKKSAMVLRFLRMAGSDPAFLEALAATLTTTPPRWRAGLFQPEADAPEAELAGLEIVLRRLMRSPAPPVREEVSPLVQAWIARGQAPRGLALWQEIFPADGARLAQGGTALLGWPAGSRFDTPLAIDWHFSGDHAMSIAVDAGRQTVLDLTMEADAFGRIATRTFAAAPGLLTLHVTPDGAGALEAIDWSIGCARGTDRVYLTRTRPDLWSVTLPAGCDVFELALEVRRGGVRGETALRLGAVRLVLAAR